MEYTAITHFNTDISAFCFIILCNSSHHRPIEESSLLNTISLPKQRQLPIILLITFLTFFTKSVFVFSSQLAPFFPLFLILLYHTLLILLLQSHTLHTLSQINSMAKTYPVTTKKIRLIVIFIVRNPARDCFTIVT